MSTQILKYTTIPPGMGYYLVEIQVPIVNLISQKGYTAIDVPDLMRQVEEDILTVMTTSGTRMKAMGKEPLLTRNHIQVRILINPDGPVAKEGGRVCH